jgi:hypothetical protein
VSLAYLERVARTCTRTGCGARIVFGRTPAGKALPFDLEPDVMGNVAVYVNEAGTVLARAVSAELPCATHEQLHLPHFATCGSLKPGPAGDSRKDNVTPIYRARGRRRQPPPSRGTLL